jgi:hypothetical protein
MDSMKRLEAHLRDQSGHHFGVRRQNSSLRLLVGVEIAMEHLESARCPHD